MYGPNISCVLFYVVPVVLFLISQLPCIQSKQKHVCALIRYYFALSIDSIHVTINVGITMGKKIEKVVQYGWQWGILASTVQVVCSRKQIDVSSGQHEGVKEIKNWHSDLTFLSHSGMEVSQLPVRDNVL